MGKFDDDRQKFLPIFWSNITERQRQDYELAKKHFGPLYRVQDTNYFMKKFKEYQTNPSSFVTIPLKKEPENPLDTSQKSDVPVPNIDMPNIDVPNIDSKKN